MLKIFVIEFWVKSQLNLTIMSEIMRGQPMKENMFWILSRFRFMLKLAIVSVIEEI